MVLGWGKSALVGVLLINFSLTADVERKPDHNRPRPKLQQRQRIQAIIAGIFGLAVNGLQISMSKEDKQAQLAAGCAALQNVSQIVQAVVRRLKYLDKLSVSECYGADDASSCYELHIRSLDREAGERCETLK
jgi:hypothetical protein